MKTQATFRLTKLAMLVGAIALSANSHAIYNLYKKDGLTLDINGQIDVQATKTDAEFVLLQDGVNWAFTSNGAAPTAHAAGTKFSSTDKKPRLNQNQGVSFVEFRGAQVLPRDWRVTGNIGLGYSDDNNLYMSNSSLSVDKKGIGAATIGRQYLHTNYVNRSGTDTPLDIFGTSALRLDYYGIKGLHTSAYYSFTGSNDVRVNDNGLDSGYGASLSYRVPFANNQSLRFGAGYTYSKFNPAVDTDWIGNTLNSNPEKVQGVAGSLEYQVGKFLIAADVGQKKETMVADKRAPIDTRTTDYLGAKLAFDINPVWQISAGYGIKKAESELKAGTLALSNDANALFTAAMAAGNTGRSGLYSYVSGDERNLYDKADTEEMYVQTDYRVRPNVRLYTRYDAEKTTYQLGGKDWSREKDNNIRAGLVFSF